MQAVSLFGRQRFCTKIGERSVSPLPCGLAVSHTSHVSHTSNALVLTPKWRLFDRKAYFYSAFPWQRIQPA